MTGRRPLTILFSALVVCVYAATAYTSFGYDDEFFNIRFVEAATSYGELARTMNSIDLHPPGQYLADKFLFDLLRDWSRVRAVIAVIVALSLVALWLAHARSSWPEWLFAWLAICCSPALLMWCTSLRWYSFFVAITNLVVLVALRRPKSSLVYWGTLSVGSALLVYLSYAALILVPAVWTVAFLQRPDRRMGMAFAAGVVLAVAPQLKIFLEVHLANATGASWRNAALGAAIHLSSSQGAMPISPFGLALIGANLLLLVAALGNWRSMLRRSEVRLFGLGAVGLLVTRLSGAMRTLVTLASLQGLVQSTVFGDRLAGHLKRVTFVLLAVGNLGGLYNVMTHQDTTKGSWNTPYARILEAFAAATATCPKVVALTHDPVLRYSLEKRVETIDVDADGDWKRALMPSLKTCVVAFETFRGTLPRSTWLAYGEAVAKRDGPRETHAFGWDAFASYKRWVDADVPDFYVTMTTFRPR